VILLLVSILLLLIVILWLLLRGRTGSGAGSGGGSGGGGGGGSGSGGGTYTIPDLISGSDLATYLRVRLAGTPADGSTAPAGSTPPTAVIWVDAGDEILVHLSSIATQIVDTNVLVSIDCETDQTGRTPLVVVFALGANASGALVAATDEFPRGNGLLAARWGIPVQQAAWNAMLALAADHATERGTSPLGLTIQSGKLRLQAGPSLTLA
jgi:hypothetical protein